MELSLDISKSAMLRYLQDKNWMETHEKVLGLEKPGEGNMNVVVRVIGDTKNLILKQSRSFVNKYPQIPAPIERIGVESEFYKLTMPIIGLSKYMPKVLGYDGMEHILLLEDLGKGADYTFVYKKESNMTSEELEAAVEFLKVLHTTSFDKEASAGFPTNLALRKLNHEHLFVYPYMEDNGFDLDTIQPGLQELALVYKTDRKLKKALEQLGNTYLGSGPTLLHGDYYPGSWLRVASGFKVIDPEFCFFGPAEYDLGVMLAHLRMAQQPVEDIEQVLVQYGGSANRQLTEQIEGMEIVRRVIGLAQLPLDLSLEEKEELLTSASGKILSNA